LTPWSKGDPVGQGQAFLPDSRSKREYANACREQIITSAARTVVALSDINARRRFINAFPEALQDDLKAHVRALWETRNKEE